VQASELNELTRILQTAISPVAMISGIGLLVLSMTNRFARTTDRARILSKQLKEAERAEGENLLAQIRILYRRSQVLLWAISFALASVFAVSLLIVALFSIYTLNADLHNLVILLFVVSLLCLVVSLLLFIQDMLLSLKALKEELRGRI
jgi:ABC-type multidrug transport system fused ATPase/permease subunit